jgi:hypothetical protein
MVRQTAASSPLYESDNGKDGIGAIFTDRDNSN